MDAQKNELAVISVREKVEELEEYWHPQVIGELNGQAVKVAKLKGELVMNHHEQEDEMFMVLKGRLVIEFEDCRRLLEEHQCIVIPRGVAHKPVAEDEVQVLLFEPQSTLNTGNVENELTRREL